MQDILMWLRAFFQPDVNILTVIKGEPELTEPFNLLINVKLRML